MLTEDYKRELSIIFFAQARVILGITVTITILALLIAFFWPPTYSATGSILVRGKKVERSPGALEEVERQISLFPLTKEDLTSEIAILTSPDVIGMTLKELDRRTGGKAVHERGKALIKRIYQVRRHLKTGIAPGSNVISVTFFSKDQEEAVATLQALMDQYVRYRTGLDNPPEIEAFYEKQAKRYLDSMDETDDRLLSLVKNSRAADPQIEIENNLRIKKDLVKELNRLVSESIDKSSYIKLLDSTLRSSDLQFFSFIENEGISRLSNRLQDLLIERGRILRKYVSGHEMVIAIDRQIDSVFGALKAEVGSYLKAQENQLTRIKRKISGIKSRISALEESNVALERQLLKTRRLALDARLLQSSYETFTKRKEEAKMLRSASVAGTFVSILTKAFPSNGPVYPQKSVVIPMGLLVGFITGCCFGLLREYFDHTFKKPSDVQRFAGLPVLFSIPDAKDEG